jgi:hypothetical protein
MKIVLALRFLHLRKVCSLLTPIGRDSGVGVATVYGQDGPGIEFQWGQFFPHPSRSALVPGLLTRGHGGVDHPPPYRAVVKESVELYLSHPSGPLGPVPGQILLCLLAP